MTTIGGPSTDAVLGGAAAPSLTPPAAVFDVEAWAARTAAPGDWFDPFEAERACQFFPSQLRHTKGRWAGQPFTLEPWQRALVRTMFGWKRADGTRRFRIVWVEIARKNGKTGLAAGVALYLAFASREPGAEVYCAASATKQAMICFTEAKRMRDRNPRMKEKTNAFKMNISGGPDGYSKIEVLSSSAGTKDGLNLSGLIGDEVHAWRDRELYEVLHTATGARTQPLEFLITTAAAGEDEERIYDDLHDHALAVRDGLIEDPEFLPVIYAAAPDDPIDDPATWAKANPNLGVSIGHDKLAKEAQRAREMPRYLNAFKRLHLNIRTEQQTLWLPLDKWDAGSRGAASVTLAALRGRTAFAGLDLSSTTDLTALALVLPRGAEDPGIDLWVHCWMPEERVRLAKTRDRVPYDQWAKQGFITVTDGNVVDYDVVRAAITGTGADGRPAPPPDGWPGPLVEILDIVALAKDRWNSAQIGTQLMADAARLGLVRPPRESWVVDFGQGFASMSAPAKEFEKLVLAGQVNHGGNPLLRWMAGCAAVKSDPADNIKPVKPDRRKSVKRIDGIVAAVMALGRAIVPAEPAPEPQVIALG